MLKVWFSKLIKQFSLCFVLCSLRPLNILVHREPKELKIIILVNYVNKVLN